jgi:hypothetical protein
MTFVVFGPLSSFSSEPALPLLFCICKTKYADSLTRCSVFAYVLCQLRFHLRDLRTHVRVIVRTPVPLYLYRPLGHPWLSVWLPSGFLRLGPVICSFLSFPLSSRSPPCSCICKTKYADSVTHCSRLCLCILPVTVPLLSPLYL